jgi:hypothetical protein
MRLPLLPLLGSLVLATSWAAAWAQPASYALISPAAVARLAGEAGTPEGRAVIRSANSLLARPPHPLPVVHTEGTLPHHGIRDQSVVAQRDWPAMLSFALAYRLTGDRRYLAAADRYFSEWLRVYPPAFNPIDETNLDQMILAFDVAGADLSPAAREAMGPFLRTLAEGYLAKIAREGIEDNANWQSHRVKLIVLSAFALGDPGLVERAHRAFLRQVSVNIRPDGSVVDFAKRDALHYVVYDLEPLTVAALAARAHGSDWFRAENRGAPSLAAALDWLTPFALGEKAHEEFVHSSVKFDADRAAVGEKGYAGPWNPATSLYLFQLASLADPARQAARDHLLRAEGAKPEAWVALAARTRL